MGLKFWSEAVGSLIRSRWECEQWSGADRSDSVSGPHTAAVAPSSEKRRSTILRIREMSMCALTSQAGRFDVIACSVSIIQSRCPVSSDSPVAYHRNWALNKIYQDYHPEPPAPVGKWTTKSLAHRQSNNISCMLHVVPTTLNVHGNSASLSGVNLLTAVPSELLQSICISLNMSGVLQMFFIPRRNYILKHHIQLSSFDNVSINKLISDWFHCTTYYQKSNRKTIGCCASI